MTSDRLDKCHQLFSEVSEQKCLVERAQECASEIAEATGDAGGTRVDMAELRDIYQNIVSDAQGKVER